MSGELKEAGYDPNRGSNCFWLPYSAVQFTRARAYGKALQKHRGGHTDAYFERVLRHVDKVAKLVKAKYCDKKEKAEIERLLYFIELQEVKIWRGLADGKLKAYHLYNSSYLNPNTPWGDFPDEVGKSLEDIKYIPSRVVDDKNAETESYDDPE
jgi:hypothetical protein